MKKLNLFLFAHCMCISLLHAQVEQPPVNGLPNILPPTPEAFALGKFGSNPIGLFTGTVQYAVPLYNINTGSISLPLSISYSSNGVKVDEVASRVGLQWKMDFGGVVNRTVRGMPDGVAELRPSTHDFYSSGFYGFMKTAGDAPTSWDTQPDEYSYSFAGYSGKFFIKNGQVIPIPVGNMEIQQSGSVFIITTPDSTKYYFGESGKYDQSRTVSEPVTCASDAYNPGFTTAWYLTRIVLRSGETVTYVYDMVNENVTEIEYPTGISQTLSFGTGTANLPPCLLSGEQMKTCYQVVAYIGVKLKEIQFLQGKVRLTYSSRDDVVNEKKLDSLIVENAEGLVVKKYKFSYEYSTSTAYNATMTGFYNSPQQEYPEIKKRLFLTKVQDCTISTDTSNKYIFEYDDINALPPRLTFAQDYWGFFNGKSNTLFFPNYTGAHELLNYWHSLGADRTASLTHSNKGMLKKITYPTGGSTNYVYEANTTAPGYELDIPSYDTVTFDGNLGDPPSPFNSSSFTLNQGKFHIYIESSAAVDPPDPMDPFQYDSLLHVRLRDANWNIYYEMTMPIRMAGMAAFNLNNLSSSTQFYLLVETDYPNVFYNVTIYSQNPLVPTKFSHVSGVRVAEVYDEDGLGNTQNHRVFKYHKWGVPDTSSGISVASPSGSEMFYSFVRTTGDVELSPTQQECSYAQLQSNSQYSLYANGQGAVNYTYVMEMLKDKTGTLTGGTEHRFQTLGQAGPFTWGSGSNEEAFSGLLVPGTSNTNTDLFDGIELEKKVFTLSSPTSRTIREHARNYYSVDARRVKIDTVYSVRKVRSRETYDPSKRYVNDFDICRYFVYSKWNHVDSAVVASYTTTGDSMVTRTHYEYADSTHLMPTRVSTWDSRNDLRYVRKKYPGEIDTLPGPVYVTLIGKNKTESVKEKFYKNTDFLFSKYTKYKSWSTSIVEPEYIEAVGPTELMSRVDFYGYTTSAKLKEVSKLNGARIAYVWDTVYNLPLAEAMNASVADVAFSSFESSAQGTWSYSNNYVTAANKVTGAKCFNLSSGSITRSTLSSSKEYIVSFWATGSVAVSGSISSVTGRTVGSWTNYIHKVNGVTSITVSGSGYVDELRLHPKGSLMKTYSYRLLTGVVAECDVNNRITYYDYDAAGRLSVLRDQDGNILKKFDYKYGSQQ